MSSDAEPTVPGREVWIEKYRPQRLADVHGHEDTIERLRSYVEQDDLPHLLFSGPAGVGKCVTGETPVLTDRGVERIGNVVGETEGFAEPDENLRVPTFGTDGTFEYTAPSDVFGKTASELIEVETRDGNDLTVTPEHKLLVVRSEGLDWTTAAELQPGDRIARPFSVPTPTDPETEWISTMNGERTFVTVSERFADEHDITRTIRLDRLRRVETDRKAIRAAVETIQYESPTGNRSRPIAPVDEVTPELARFVGLAVAEARVDDGRIEFYNTDESLLDTFERLTHDLFDLEPVRGVQHDVPYVRVISRSLTHFLESVFDAFPSQDNTESGPIGSALVTAPETAQASFLQAMYDAEGHVTDHGTVELTQKSEDTITLLSYLLSSLGIPSRHRTEWKAATNSNDEGDEYHTLYVSGARHLRRFRDQVGFTLEPKATRLADDAAKDSNPNHDTIPTQRRVRTLCERLNLNVTDYLTESLDADSPGRVTYLNDVDGVVTAATERLEAAQQVLERIESIRHDLRQVTRIPSTWIDVREQLEPLAVRKEISETTGVRTDRLLKYADDRRTPTATRAETILDELDNEDLSRLDRDGIRQTLTHCIETLGIEYETVTDGTDLRGTGLISLLKRENQDLGLLPRFQTVARRIETLAADMLSVEVIQSISELDRLVSGSLYFDEVTDVERSTESRRVYDLTVPDTRNYVAGTVPTVMHNTTSAIAIAREIYGDSWESYFLELNASDERGIDVVRDRIKSFARSSFAPDHGHTIVFLDEADSLCLPPGTEVVTGYPSSPEVKPIEAVAEDGEPMPSVDFETNEIQSDKGRLIDSGVADFFEVELADGREITASPTHPFFVVGDDGQLVEKELRELRPGDEIADFRDEIGVSQCEICGDWTDGRFCSLDCKNEGHSRAMEGEGNPMHGTEWSDERRAKIIEKLSDGRFAGENNPNYGGEFHGTHVWEMDEETVERVKNELSEMRSGTPWEEWVVDADPDAVRRQIGQAAAEWWESPDEAERARLHRKAAANTDYPVRDITGDNNPMRDPDVARKVSEALQGHEPTGGNVRYCEKLGHRVRSDWEYEVAEALHDAGIEYKYEPSFELSDTTFYPDFLIGDTVIEVKGAAELWGRIDEVEEFLDLYGDSYEFVVVGDENLPHHERYELDEFDPAVVSDGGRRPVETTEIRRIEYSHRGPAYNISMKGTPNFILGNGILTHNTDDAQSALRRTMEQFSDNTRFVLSCNYSSKIIDPIQSRCAVFRFSPLSDEAIAGQVREIAETEKIELTEEGLEALVYAADGDMRRAINNLQGVATTEGPVTEDDVYQITATARPEEIESMVSDAIAGDFSRAQATLERLLTETGIAGGDVIDQLHRSAWEFDLSDRETVRLIERVGDADYRISEGANERVQLEALLAALALKE